MANHKSAKKRAKQDITRHNRNRSWVRQVKTYESELLKVLSAESVNKAEAEASLKAFSQKIDRAAARGVISKARASRRTSILAKKVHQATS